MLAYGQETKFWADSIAQKLNSWGTALQLSLGASIAIETLRDNTAIDALQDIYNHVVAIMIAMKQVETKDNWSARLPRRKTTHVIS